MRPRSVRRWSYADTPDLLVAFWFGFLFHAVDAERIGEGASFVSLEFAKGAAAFQALQWLDRNGFPSKE